MFHTVFTASGGKFQMARPGIIAGTGKYCDFLKSCRPFPVKYIIKLFRRILWLPF